MIAVTVEALRKAITRQPDKNLIVFGVFNPSGRDIVSAWDGEVFQGIFIPDMKNDIPQASGRVVTEDEWERLEDKNQVGVTATILWTEGIHDDSI